VLSYRYYLEKAAALRRQRLAAPKARPFLSQMAKLGAWLESLLSNTLRVWPPYSDAKTSCHYLAGVSPNTMPAIVFTTPMTNRESLTRWLSPGQEWRLVLEP
jgi:hypothetical protein